MKDRFGREITYLRVSVTGRCNSACRYCVGLVSDLRYGVRELGPEQALLRALRNKPESGLSRAHDWMHGIGG